MTYTLGIDVSKWQGVMNWAKAEARMRELNPDGKAFAIVRAGSIDNTTGKCYTDDQYFGNVDYVKDLDECGFYWYFRPNHDVLKQEVYFLDLIEAEFGPLSAKEWGEDRHGRYFIHNEKKVRLYLDVEEHGNLFASVVTARINTFFPKADLYSRANWLNEHTTRDIAKVPRYLWIARYANLQGPWADYATYPQYKPRDWDAWAIWQFSAGGNGRGAEFGAQSASIDLNYTSGQLVPVETGGTEPPSPPAPEPPADWQAIFDALNTVNVKLDTVLENQSDILHWLDKINDVLDGLDDLPPPPSATIVLTVKADKTLAHEVVGHNAKGYPIMAIYETPRIRFDHGAAVEVYPDRIDADGTIDYYKLADNHGAAVDLFVQADDF